MSPLTVGGRRAENNTQLTAHHQSTTEQDSRLVALLLNGELARLFLLPGGWRT